MECDIVIDLQGETVDQLGVLHWKLTAHLMPSTILDHLLQSKLRPNDTGRRDIVLAPSTTDLIPHVSMPTYIDRRLRDGFTMLKYDLQHRNETGADVDLRDWNFNVLRK